MMYGEVEVQVQALASALDGGELSTSCLSHFTPGVHWVGNWVDLRARLDAVAMSSILWPMSW
jgi:hypothetical protein